MILNEAQTKTFVTFLFSNPISIPKETKFNDIQRDHKIFKLFRNVVKVNALHLPAISFIDFRTAFLSPVLSY